RRYGHGAAVAAAALAIAEQLVPARVDGGRLLRVLLLELVEVREGARELEDVAGHGAARIARAGAHGARPAPGAIRRPSRNTPPVSVAVTPNSTLAAPSSTERGAPRPPMSVRTQPGHVAFTRIWRSASSAARIRVSALSAAFEAPYASVPQ